MKDNKKWYRVYFNRNWQVGATPDQPARVNVYLVSLDQDSSTAAIQLEYSASASWTSAKWNAAPPADLLAGLEMACCQFAADLHKLVAALGVPGPNKFSFQHHLPNGSNGFLQLVPVNTESWRVNNLAEFGAFGARALRLAIVTLLKTKIRIARALGMADQARTVDMLNRINTRAQKGEVAHGGHPMGLSPAISGAFFGDRGLREQLIARVTQHRLAQQVVQGSVIWSGEFGSAVGCTLHGENFDGYEHEFGIARVLACLKEALFQRLPAEEAVLWPERFLAAVRPNADLSKVWAEFVIWLLNHPEQGLIAHVDEEFCDFHSTPPTRSTEQHRVFGAIVALLREGCSDNGSWGRAASDAFRVLHGLRDQHRALALRCAAQIAQYVSHKPAEADINGLDFFAVNFIVTSAVEAYATRWASGCGHDGPDAEELYPRLYICAANKLLELLSAASASL